MDDSQYIYDETLATVLYVSLQLGRPLLIEGAAGVGKTEVAKVMAAALDRDLVRLQCYEGLDESKALYEWNYQKQLLAIQVKKQTTQRVEPPEAAAGHPGEPERPGQAGADQVPVQRRVPAGTAHAEIHPLRKAAGAAD